MSVAFAAVVAGGCSIGPTLSTAGQAPQLLQIPTSTGALFTLSPWEYDTGTAFLCLRDPSPAFTDTRQVPPAAGCAPLEATVANDRLSAIFDIRDVPPDLLPGFQASSAPWYLAVAGARGATSQALVTTIQASPISSNSGPS